MTARWLAVGLAGVVLASACSGSDEQGTATTSDSTTTGAPHPPAVTVTTPDTSEPVFDGPVDGPVGPVVAPVRHPATARSIYFVMPDRFANGDPTNDTAGVRGGPLDHGFDPTRRGYHHGGDLAGLTERLPYLAGLGMEAIWITPPFTNRWVQGDGTLDGSSSSYHGYWQIDWDRVDPHLGTEEEMQAFIAAAHARDMHVYFDVVINHTGDVIAFAEDTYVYLPQAARPYLDATGEPFDPSAVAGGDDFPDLDAATSFPYTPTFVDPADATAKSPGWLDDVTLYHNRGDSTFSGESVTFGDFFGLDDVFTEHPRVVEGMIELYGDLIERYDVDGFRVDTMKHVDAGFWEQWVPAIRRRAADLGKPDFFIFGEVFNEDPVQQSSYTNLGVSATLDFIIAGGIERYVTNGDGELLAQEFDDDDWFTDADNNASMQVTFFGNHDQGRMGHLLERAEPGADDDRLPARARLVNDLLFLTRGAPVVYYGDEQGFTGSGGDQLARQDMFPTLTAEYADDDSIGTDATPADDNFDPEHPLYRHIAALNGLRRDHPVFATGAQIVHATEGPIFAFSRLDRDERIEYVVLTNSDASAAVPASIAVLSADTTFRGVRAGDPPEVTTATDGQLSVEVPPLTTIVLRAEQPIAAPDGPTTIDIVRPAHEGEIPTVRYRIEAELGDRRYAEVTFAVAVDGGEPVVIGVDDAAPYRVYWSNEGLSTGASVEVFATVSDGYSPPVSDTALVTIGDRS